MIGKIFRKSAAAQPHEFERAEREQGFPRRHIDGIEAHGDRRRIMLEQLPRRFHVPAAIAQIIGNIAAERRRNLLRRYRAGAQHRGRIAGKIKKFDVVTGKADWEIPDPYPNWSGTMVTDGGLMFYGSKSGHFRAVDRNSGKVLWQKKLGSGIIGNPITYKIKGKQYVSIFAGLGGWIGIPVTAGLDMNDKFGAIGATAMAKATGLDKIPQGGELYTFALGE